VTAALTAEIEEARGRILATLAAGDRGWDTPPLEGEWSPRDIARHVFENDYFFAGQVASIVAAPIPNAPASPFGSGGAAIDALHASAGVSRSVLESVNDDNLDHPWQHGMSLADLLGFYAEHTREHVEQLRALRERATLAS